MLNARRTLQLIVLASAAIFTACAAPEHAGIARDVRRELAASDETLDRWVDAQRGGALPSDEVVLGLGYAERLRLGLGSPFRLVELALRDPRLSESARREVAWTLLARTLEGAAYQIDPVALDRAGLGTVANWPGLGRHHLNIIENAIVESRDPRGGELAVRLAYRLAAMEGSLPPQAPRFAIRVAALIRDRELARADAARLLESAEAAQGDPLTAVAKWRAERHFHVEAPAMTPLPAQVEREALELAPRLAQALRMLRPRLGDVTANRPDAPDVNGSLLSKAAAARLERLADSLHMPPQAPVAVALRSYRQEMLQQPWLTPAERKQRDELTLIGQEERFAAAYAQLARSSPHDAAPSLAVVAAAVGLRTYAQEPVWFPGFGGPTARELEERYGLASLRFAESIPADWRPYYRSMLDLALRDMQRVLPALDVRGLNVRFGAAKRGASTLAMHDPKARALVLPPGSSAGTIAHEVAHDLDWQVALQRYRVRGDYASDRASRIGTDRLAARVSVLASDAALDAVPERGQAHARRPAENFARAIDWFVASSLAAQGRLNGYLSSVQDDMLTGYGTVRAPDLSGRAGDALINILDEVAPLYPETRDWFLKRYGSARAMSSYDLVRAVDEIDLPEPALLARGPAPEGAAAVNPAFAALRRTRENGFAAIDESICRSPGGVHDADFERARRRLVVEATAARGRGVALQQARRIAGEAGTRWVARRLYGGPWPQQDIEPAIEELLAELVAEARAVAEPVVVRAPGASFELLATPGRCTILARSY